MIHQNTLIPLRNRDVSNCLPSLRAVPAMFQMVQIEHRVTSGNKLISLSVFLSRSPDARLDHAYTTFWNYDTTETYFSTAFVNQMFVGNPEIQGRREFYLPLYAESYLDNDPDFQNDLFRSSPVLFKAIFSGNTTPSRCFGIPEKQQPFTRAVEWFDPNRLTNPILESYIHLPLGSYRSTPVLQTERSRDDSDWEFSGASEIPEDHRNHMYRAASLFGVLTTHTSADLFDQASLETVTVDRMVISQWRENTTLRAFDMLTAPFTALMRNHGLKAFGG